MTGTPGLCQLHSARQTPAKPSDALFHLPSSARPKSLGSPQAHLPARVRGPVCICAGLAGTGVLGSEETISLHFLLSGPSRIRSGVLYFPLTCSNSWTWGRRMPASQTQSGSSTVTASLRALLCLQVVAHFAEQQMPLSTAAWAVRALLLSRLPGLSSTSTSCPAPVPPCPRQQAPCLHRKLPVFSLAWIMMWGTTLMKKKSQQWTWQATHHLQSVDVRFCKTAEHPPPPLYLTNCCYLWGQHMPGISHTTEKLAEFSPKSRLDVSLKDMLWFNKILGTMQGAAS